MTDIGNKIVGMPLFRWFAVLTTVISCTWWLSGGFNDAKREFYGLKESIIVLTQAFKQLSKSDSLKTIEIAELKKAKAVQGHDLDSLKKVLHKVVVKTHVKLGIAYYRQRKVNGHLVTELVDD